MNPTLDKKNAIIAGVCAGIGKHYGKDVFLIRLLAILILLFTGIIPGLIAYLVLALIMD